MIPTGRSGPECDLQQYVASVYPREYEIAEWFVRDYEGTTIDDVAELLACYRAELYGDRGPA